MHIIKEIITNYKETKDSFTKDNLFVKAFENELNLLRTNNEISDEKFEGFRKILNEFSSYYQNIGDNVPLSYFARKEEFVMKLNELTSK